MMPTPPVAYNSLGAVISIAVLGSLLVALVALVIGYRHWQKGKERQHLAVAYSSGRLDSSEYVMPGELAWGRGAHSRAPTSLPGPRRGEMGSWREKGAQRADPRSPGTECPGLALTRQPPHS